MIETQGKTGKIGAETVANHLYQKRVESDLKDRNCAFDETWLALRFHKLSNGDFYLAEIWFAPHLSSGFEQKHRDVTVWFNGIRSLAIYFLVLASRAGEKFPLGNKILIESALSNADPCWIKSCYQAVEKKPKQGWCERHFGSKIIAGQEVSGLELVCKIRRPTDRATSARSLELWLPAGESSIRPRRILVYTSQKGSDVRLLHGGEEIASVAQNIEAQVENWEARVESIRSGHGGSGVLEGEGKNAGTSRLESDSLYNTTRDQTEVIRILDGSSPEQALAVGFVPETESIPHLWNLIFSIAESEGEKNLLVEEYKKCVDLAGRINRPADRAQIVGVYAIKWLTTHVERLSDCKLRLLRNSIEWTLDPDATWNIRYQSFILSNALTARFFSDGSYSWRDHEVIAAAMSSALPPILGSPWILILVVFFGDSNTAEQCLKLMTEWFCDRPPEQSLISSLDIVMSVRTILLTILDIKSQDAVARIQQRIEVIHRLIDLKHLHAIRYRDDEDTSQLLAIYAQLIQITKVLPSYGKSQVLRTTKRIVKEREREIRCMLAADSKADNSIITAAKALDTAVNRAEKPWLAEGACLHDIEGWTANGRFTEPKLRNALIRFYRVIVTRSNCSKTDFQTWREVFDAFGAASFEPQIRALAVEAAKKHYVA